MPRTSFSILVLMLLASELLAENWPRFRGPTGQGVSAETGLSLHWSATSNVIWKTAITGEAWSSPIVWGDRVFVTSATEIGTKCYVLCLDRRSGKTLWDKHVFDQVPLRKEGKNSYASSTPCTDGERVYAVFGDGSIVALTFDGAIVWSYRDFKYYSRHGLGASPIVHNGLLIMPYDWSSRVTEAGKYPDVSTEERTGWQIPWDKSFILALDTKTGKQMWTGKRGLSRIGHATPVILRSHGDEQLLSITGDVVQGFNLKTGERIWSVYCQGEGLVPSPVVGDGMVFAASGFEKTTLRGIRTNGKGDVTQTHIAWEQKRGVPTLASLLYVSPHVFAITADGIATCYRAETGDIVWQERVGGNHTASPVFADGKIYFLSEQGETTIVAADPEFKILFRNSIGEKCQSSMALSQKQIFIRSDKNLFCIGQSKQN